MRLEEPRAMSTNMQMVSKGLHLFHQGRRRKEVQETLLMIWLHMRLLQIASLLHNWFNFLNTSPIFSIDELAISALFARSCRHSVAKIRASWVFMQCLLKASISFLHTWRFHFSPNWWIYKGTKRQLPTWLYWTFYLLRSLLLCLNAATVKKIIVKNNGINHQLTMTLINPPIFWLNLNYPLSLPTNICARASASNWVSGTSDKPFLSWRISIFTSKNCYKFLIPDKSIHDTRA